MAAIVVMAAIVFVAANIGVGFIYANRIYPQTSIASMPAGNLTVVEADRLLQKKLDSESINLSLQGDIVTLTPKQAGIKYQTTEMVDRAAQDNGSLPLVDLMAHLLHPRLIQPIVLADSTTVKQMATKLAKQYSIDPTDASVVVNGQTATLVSDRPGIKYDPEQIQLAIIRGSQINTQTLIIPKKAMAQITGKSLIQAVATATRIAKCSVAISVQGKTYQIDQKTMDSWIVVNSNTGSVTIDNQAVEDYVATIAHQYDMSAVPTIVTTLDGAVTSTQTGKAGQALDSQAAIASIVDGLGKGVSVSTAAAVVSVAPSTKYIRQTSPTGKRIVVSISQQHLWAYDGATQVYDSAVVTGASAIGDATPIGTWHIYSKVVNTYLRGPTWDDFVQYWMPFWGPYGLHDASWRDPSQFGTPSYPYVGSHGCINLPTATAAWIYNWAPIGTAVTVEW
jgi:lipoprotein-anchoring transpeptidase ErfK/SrfK